MVGVRVNEKTNGVREDADFHGALRSSDQMDDFVGKWENQNLKFVKEDVSIATVGEVQLRIFVEINRKTFKDIQQKLIYNLIMEH